MLNHEKGTKCADCNKVISDEEGYALIGGCFFCLACLRGNDRRAERIAHGECVACGTKLKNGVCEHCRAEKAIAP